MPVKPAILIVDMLKDAFRGNDSTREDYRKIVPRMRRLLDEARARGIPVIFACDSFLEGDFFFRGGRPYCLRGTEGAEVIDELRPIKGEHVLPKRRFSAFFKTDLDQTLRLLGVDTVAIGGINTHVCVYATAMDAVCNDFNAIVLEDCSATRDGEAHRMGIELLRLSRLQPVLRIMSSEEFLAMPHNQGGKK